MQEFEVPWEDGSIWDISWFHDAGCFMADRWFPDGDDEGADGPFIESPAPEMVLVEDLDTLEAVMGRPLPSHIRDELIAESRCYPFTPEMREAWREDSAFGITRLHPSGEWIATLASPGDPDPFAYRWLPEWLAATWDLGT